MVKESIFLDDLIEKTNDAGENNIISPRDFYFDCVNAYNKIARSHGVLYENIKVIPELLEYGIDIILYYLHNKDFYEKLTYNEEEEDLENLYRRILMIAIDSGVVLGECWQLNSSDIRKKLEEIKLKPPVIFIIWDNVFNLVPMEVFQFYGDMYCEFTEQLYPLWNKIPDMRLHLLYAFLAGFQLGVSAILEKRGYR